MAKVVLSVQNVVKKFVGTVALKGVSVNLYENEILALLGENGAGKSTLMKILSGIYPYGSYEGKIEVNGQECRFHNPVDSEKSGIAMIYQELNLELDLSIGENIVLGQYPKTKYGSIDWKRLHQEAAETLKEMDIDLDTHMTVRSLSPSMQQLVSIARALYRKPKILILDEPTSVLTEAETERLMQLLRRLCKRGIACIYISHKLDEVFKLCDRIVIFRDGIKTAECEKKDGYNSSKIIEDMIGRHLDNLFPERVFHPGEEVLRVENFKVPHPSAYGKQIIKDVSFSLRKGEILGLAGLVGAGRSELANAVYGSMKKITGRVYIDQKEVEIQSPEDAIQEGMGLVSEDRKKNGFVGSMSVQENMTLATLKELKSGIFIDAGKERKLAEEYFKKLQVKSPNLKTLITNLSGGNQQKVILAKWMMTDIKILILDEPTRGIDVGTKYEIYKLMQELTEKGISIIMISSEMPELLAMSDRILVLGKGVIKGEFTRGETDELQLMKVASSI